MVKILFANDIYSLQTIKTVGNISKHNVTTRNRRGGKIQNIRSRFRGNKFFLYDYWDAIIDDENIVVV